MKNSLVNLVKFTTFALVLVWAMGMPRSSEAGNTAPDCEDNGGYSIDLVTCSDGCPAEADIAQLTGGEVGLSTHYATFTVSWDPNHCKDPSNTVFDLSASSVNGTGSDSLNGNLNTGVSFDGAKPSRRSNIRKIKAEYPDPLVPGTMTFHMVLNEGTTCADLVGLSAITKAGRQKFNSTVSVSDNRADLSADVNGPRGVFLNESVDYTFTINNSGPSAATAVLEVNLPPSFIINKITPQDARDTVIVISNDPPSTRGGRKAGSVLVYPMALPSGGSATLTVEVTPTQTGQFSLTADVNPAPGAFDDNACNNVGVFDVNVQDVVNFFTFTESPVLTPSAEPVDIFFTGPDNPQSFSFNGNIFIVIEADPATFSFDGTPTVTITDAAGNERRLDCVFVQPPVNGRDTVIGILTCEVNLDGFESGNTTKLTFTPENSGTFDANMDIHVSITDDSGNILVAASPVRVIVSPGELANCLTNRAMTQFSQPAGGVTYCIEFPNSCGSPLDVTVTCSSSIDGRGFVLTGGSFGANNLLDLNLDFSLEIEQDGGRGFPVNSLWEVFGVPSNPDSTPFGCIDLSVEQIGIGLGDSLTTRCDWSAEGSQSQTETRVTPIGGPSD